jgi:hypothetical protein
VATHAIGRSAIDTVVNFASHAFVHGAAEKREFATASQFL